MSSLPDLVVPIDEQVVEIDRNGITRIVSEIIINNSKQLTSYDDILFSIVRLMYHDILVQLDIDDAKTVFNLIEVALLQNKHSNDSTLVINKNLFSEYNIRHFLSNIQASVHLIHMTLLQNENFSINNITIDFLASLNLKKTLIMWLRLMTDNSVLDDNYISMTNQSFKTSLKRLHEQRAKQIYLPIEIEEAIERTDDFATYKQYCQKL